MSLYDLACQQLWAMREGELRGLLSLLARESLDPDLARQIRADRASRPSALAAQAGSRLDGARGVTMRGSVALLEVIGPIVRRADMFSEISGATDVGTLSRDFATALAAPNVEAVLFVLDSPGGEVGGIAEFAAMIAAADKPVWAYGEAVIASACYWLASAMDRIVIDKTALVGSIGVAMAVPDPTKANSKDITFVSSQSPHKRPDPTTETGRGQLQALVDATAAEFVADVATYRGVSVETVLADFGQGGVMVGKAALTAGLVDALGSFESTLADLQAAVIDARQQSPNMRGAMEDSMDWAAFWKPLLGENAAVEAAPLAAPLAALIDQQGSAVRLESANADSAELVAMRAQIAQMQTERIAQDASAFVHGQIAAGHAYPAEIAALTALTIRAAQLDANLPIPAGEPTTLALAARPANRLAGQLLPSALPTGAVVLTNASGDGAGLDEAEASARAYAVKANGRANK
jgi:capsid assembly protease